MTNNSCGVCAGIAEFRLGSDLVRVAGSADPAWRLRHPDLLIMWLVVPEALVSTLRGQGAVGIVRFELSWMSFDWR
jgi:hypothetical protein